MPKKPRRPCRMNGCPNLAEDGELYCSEHKGMDTQEYNRYRRDPEAKKRYGRAWKRIRDSYVQQHPVCELCQQDGRLTPTEEVHHKIPLLAYPIGNSSMANSVVLDPFGGSGSTLIACEQTDRICRTVELDEKFCDVIVNRYIEQVGSSEGVTVLRDGKTWKYEEIRNAL